MTARHQKGSSSAHSRTWVRRFLMVLCLVAGLACLAYPLVGTFLNERSFTDAVSRYEETVSSYSEEDRAAMLEAARAYNDSLRGDPVRDPFVENSGYAIPDSYQEILNVDGEGLMGVVSIPSINVRLPIYHGTSEDVLAHGAGHIPQTSFPIGGLGTHAVITGHTGFPTARLFNDLVELKEGDVFIIEVLGEKHGYCIDSIQIVEPDDLSSVQIDPEQDYVTLLTCTPYGINSHRLLVRGVACDLPEEAIEPTPPEIPYALILGMAALVAIGSAVAVAHHRRKSKARGDIHGA